jgi:hypothetical protein
MVLKKKEKMKNLKLFEEFDNEDLTDYRKWKKGDFLICVKKDSFYRGGGASYPSDLTIGDEYEIAKVFMPNGYYGDRYFSLVGDNRRILYNYKHFMKKKEDKINHSDIEWF